LFLENTIGVAVWIVLFLGEPSQKVFLFPKQDINTGKIVYGPIKKNFTRGDKESLRSESGRIIEDIAKQEAKEVVEKALGLKLTNLTNSFIFSNFGEESFKGKRRCQFLLEIQSSHLPQIKSSSDSEILSVGVEDLSRIRKFGRDSPEISNTIVLYDFDYKKLRNLFSTQINSGLCEMVF